jgi:two-component system, LuxR family, sensor kinase FixL
MPEGFLEEKRGAILIAAAEIIVGIAVVDALLAKTSSVGLLYVFPILLMAMFLPRWQVLQLALVVSVMQELFGPDQWVGNWTGRVLLSWLAYGAAGLVVVEARRRKRSEWANEQRVDAAELAAATILESSPAAILAVNPDGTIGMRNEAANRLLGIGGEGARIGDHFPLLAEMLRSPRRTPMVRTMIECRGNRADGASFFAQMWLSTFPAAGGMKLVAVVADVSEQMRDREELGLRQLLMHSSIIAGAVSHEIRNLAVAAEMLHERMGEKFVLGGNEDYEALGRLIEALRKLSAPEAPASPEVALLSVDVNALMGELKIISASGEFETELEWSLNEGLPRVRADHSGLLQVLLNLLRNSQRALEGQEDGRIRIQAYPMGDSVVISFADNGPGVGRPETLFQPFQPGAQATGLGLYISRAIVRTYGGELQYDRQATGSRFVIQLPVAGEGGMD